MSSIPPEPGQRQSLGTEEGPGAAPSGRTTGTGQAQEAEEEVRTP
ncbi:hypothetical protein ACH4ND_03850 [Streptomyces sp. NPDC017179]